MGILADKQPNEIAAELLVKFVNSRLAHFANDYKRSFDMVWNRTDGITPQEVLDAFGTSAAELFAHSLATKNYIIGLKPSLLSEAYLNPPLPVTINPDGTVTVQI